LHVIPGGSVLAGGVGVGVGLGLATGGDEGAGWVGEEPPPPHRAIATAHRPRTTMTGIDRETPWTLLIDTLFS
jgi:hypothetical protein